VAFTQDLFTSRRNYADGNLRIGEIDRLWYDSLTNTIRIGDGNPGGKIVSGSSLGSTVYSGDTPPAMPQVGWLWYDTVSGRLYVYEADIDSSQWVDASPNLTTYTLPIASSITLGGVKIGANISVAGDGTIDVIFPDNIVNNYSNANVIAYLIENPQPGTYGDSNVAAYLPTYTGNVNAAYYFGDGGLLSNIAYNNYSNVNVEAWFSANISDSLYSNVNVAAYLSTTSIGGNLDLGNLYITDETIGGKITNRDITLLPSGTGLVAVPGLKVPVGSIVQGVSNITAVVTSTVISTERYSTSVIDNLNIGDYGLDNGISGAAPGWTVYRAYGNVTFGNTIQIGDSFVGAGIPGSSTVLFVGNVSGTDPANANVIITTYTLNNLSELAANTLAYTTRSVVNAGFAISTSANVDITLNPGLGGNIVPAGSIIPLVSGVYNLGTPSRRFKEIWIGAGTIYVQDETLGTDQVIGARDGNLYVGGGTGFTVGKFTLTGNTIALNNLTEDFYIGTPYATGNLNIRRPFQVLNNSSNIAFAVTRSGRVQIDTGYIPGNDPGALLVNGSLSSSYPSVVNPGGMLHVVGTESNVSRITLDSVGTFAGSGAYTVFTSRAARGTYTSPSATQAGDTFLRLSGVGYGTTGYPVGGTTIELAAAQTFTDTAAGTQINFYTTPLGNTGATGKTLSAVITPYGITLPNVATIGTGTGSFTGNGGITFADNTRQTTAFIPSNSVRKITTGTGFLNPGTYQGNVSLDTTDVHSLVSDSYSLTVSDLGSNNLKLHLAQEIAPNSSPTFSNVTVTNMNVTGNLTFYQSPVIQGKILYLANNSSSSTDINGGGIVLGDQYADYSRHILYSTTGTYGDYWYTDSDTGFQTEHLVATDAYLMGNINVTGTGRFGGAYTGYNFPNAGLQVFENVNSYAQIVEQNLSTGTAASTDFIATSDAGTDTAFYVDLGINGSNFDNSNPINSLGTSTDKNDAYLYIQGNLSNTSSPGGNLTVGVNTPGRVIKFIAGGGTAGDIVATFSDTSLSTPVQIVSTVATGTAPLIVASTTRVNNLNVARSGLADALTPGKTINGVLFDATANITVTANASTLTGTYLNPSVINSSLQTVGTLANLTTTGNINSGSWVVATASGVFNANVYTNYFVGSGRYLTELPGYAYSNANVNSYLSITTNSPGAESLTLTNGVFTFTPANLSIYAWNANVTTANTIQSNQINAINANIANLQASAYSNVNVYAYLTVNGYINNIQPRTLTSNVHIAANVVGNTATIITDATTANVANTIVVRDSTGTINVSGWTVGTRLTAVDYTATNSDYWIGTAAKNLTITLPNAANGAANGRQYQIADTVHNGNPGTTIAAQSPSTAIGNQPSQQGQIIICTYVGGVWYLN
jgi:hypothetical protein